MKRQLLYMRFFYVKNRKFERMPVRSVRMQGAFINPTVPRAIALPVWKVKKHSTSAKLDKTLWPGIKLGKMVMFTYPTIKEYEWFTYKKNGDGKIKRVTLFQYMRGNQK